MLLSLGSKNIWENETPSSLRFCRPVMFEFLKENVYNIQSKYKFYEKKISELRPKKNSVKGGFVTIRYNVNFTMIDGKVCNALTGQKSSSNCNICNASPLQMNNIELIKGKEETFKTEFYKFGLSPLHCKIRFMEALLNIRYHKEFEKNSCRGFKDEKKKRKKLIQEKLKASIGILVDVVKQGFGTTNSGNTARRFFDPVNRQQIADILEIDTELIRRPCVILEVLPANKKINTELFEKCCYETAELWVKLYEWK